MAKDDPLKILIIQAAYLGDVVLSTPVLSNLKKMFPNSELYTLTTPLATEFFKFDPRVKEAIPFDKRGKHAGISGLFNLADKLKTFKFDKVYSLHRSIRTSILVSLIGVRDTVCFSDAWGSFLYSRKVKRSDASHAVLRNISILELDLPETELQLYPDPNFQIPEKPYVCLFPGSEWYTKRWQGFRQATQILLGSGKRVVVLGAPQEKTYNANLMEGLPVLDLTGKTRLSETMTIVSHASGVVCNDSMALHLASAFSVPRVAVFCATSPSFGFGPWGKLGAVVEEPYLPCKPCRRHGSNHCPTGTNACMTRVRSEDVIERLNELSN